jgi:hypothetical protein
MVITAYSLLGHILVNYTLFCLFRCQPTVNLNFPDANITSDCQINNTTY